MVYKFKNKIERIKMTARQKLDNKVLIIGVLLLSVILAVAINSMQT